jgi:membrane-associated phospholipid phosphatase
VRGATGPAAGRWIALGLALAFLVLAVVVRLGLLDAWDSSARAWFRPNDEWGPRQLRADRVVEGLRPPVIVPMLGPLVLIMSGLRRSIWPAVLAGGTILLLVGVTLATQIAVARPDPHGVVDSPGGSFPSGHTATIIVVFGLLILLLQPRPRWWLWLVPAGAGAAMGGSLLIQAAHWTTDVVGGALLAAGVLAAVCATGLPSLAGHSRAGHSRAGHSRAGHGRAGPEPTGPGPEKGSD